MGFVTFVVVVVVVVVVALPVTTTIPNAEVKSNSNRETVENCSNNRFMMIMIIMIDD